ncbi:MAG TPA: TIGR02611 family protein [Jatrophihabitans sp.]|nr:TIGR02611 family protein [Jatrophihabitans sp.]
MTEDETAPRPPRWVHPIRNRALRVRGGLLAWRIGVAVLGGLVVAGGLVLIPLPGPGWAIVFLGLAVWATEFVWAQRLLRFGRRVLHDWTEWTKRQPRWLQALLGLVGLVFLAGLAWLGWRFLR